MHGARRCRRKGSGRLGLVILLGAGALMVSTAPAAVAAAPTVQATWVTDVTATSANLRTQIDSGGSAGTYRFEYISEAAYQANLAAVPAREGFSGAAKAPVGGAAAIGPGPLTQPIGRLSPSSIYRYRVVATTSEGTTVGPERSFGTQEPTNVFRLLDGRGWEMVSPIDKNGGAIQGFNQNFGGDTLQAAAGGDSVTYSSADSFGAAPQGAPPASQYLARRGVTGWVSDNITVPLPAGGYGDEPDGVPYQLFSTDLARGLLLNGRRCGESGPCPLGYSLRDSATGALTPSPEAPDLRFAGASSDLRHVVLSTCAALTPDATEVGGGGGSCDPAATNLYEWSSAGLALVNPAPGAELAAQAGAISGDGRRLYFTRPENGTLFLREEGEPVRPVPKTGGGVVFQTASADGRFAFLLDAIGHLLRYDASSEATTDLTPGGAVQGVLGASADGSHVYYLTAAGLFLWNEGVVTEVATSAAASNYPPATGTARVTADGSHLLFLSAAELTGYENNGVTEAFLYGPPPGGGPAELTCVSCNPTGERPRGPSSIPGAIANGKSKEATRAYKPRALSSDGSRVFFDSSDSLAIQDTNLRPDVYEWEARGAGGCTRAGGCIGLISSGRSPQPSTFVDASESGSDVFFLTDSSLFPLDPGSYDLYDARVGGGFALPPVPIPCLGDACQALPSAPEDPTPGTLVPNPGNPPLKIAKQKKRKKHRHGKGQRKHRGGK